MYNQQRFRFELSFSNQPYCPQCCVALCDGNAAIKDGWLQCVQCVFKGGTGIGILEHAIQDGRIAMHLSVSRYVIGYTPRGAIRSPIPLVELIVMCNECVMKT